MTNTESLSEKDNQAIDRRLQEYAAYGRIADYAAAMSGPALLPRMRAFLGEGCGNDRVYRTTMMGYGVFPFLEIFAVSRRDGNDFLTALADGLDQVVNPCGEDEPHDLGAALDAIGDGEDHELEMAETVGEGAVHAACLRDAGYAVAALRQVLQSYSKTPPEQLEAQAVMVSDLVTAEIDGIDHLVAGKADSPEAETVLKGISWFERRAAFARAAGLYVLTAASQASPCNADAEIGVNAGCYASICQDVQDMMAGSLINGAYVAFFNRAAREVVPGGGEHNAALHHYLRSYLSDMDQRYDARRKDGDPGAAALRAVMNDVGARLEKELRTEFPFTPRPSPRRAKPCAKLAVAEPV